MKFRPLFKLIQEEQSNTDWKEMYQVFNMWSPMRTLCPKSDIACDVIAISESFGVSAQIIGRVESSPKKKLTIDSVHGHFGIPLAPMIL